MFSRVGKDERSEDEETEEEEEDVKHNRKTNGIQNDNKTAETLLEHETGMGTDKPVVLLNGEPVTENGSTAKPEGITKRKSPRKS